MTFPSRRILPDGASRLLLFGALFVALSAAGLYAVYAQMAERSLQFDVRLLAPLPLAALGGLLIVYFTADGLRLYYILRVLGERVPARAMARLVFINLFFSNITPLATGGGFAQIWYLRGYGVNIGKATAATTIRTMLAVVFIFSAAPLCLLVVDDLAGLEFIRELLPYIAALAAGYLAVFAVLLLRPRWLLFPVDRLLCWLPRVRLVSENRVARWRWRLRRELVHFVRSFSRYAKGSPRFIVLSVLCTAVFLVSLFSFPAVLLWSLGYEVDYFRVLGLLAVTTFFMYFTPTPGASGLAEGLFARLFAGLVSPPHLVLVTLAWRFCTIYLGVLIGMVIVQRDLVRSGRHRDSK